MGLVRTTIEATILLTTSFVPVPVPSIASALLLLLQCLEGNHDGDCAGAAANEGMRIKS